jgi:hypothetical protein
MNLEHNNLGGHGPDVGDEGIRYEAVLTGAGMQEMEIFVELHASSNGSYMPARNRSNGLAGGMTRTQLRRLCNESLCMDPVKFGTINMLSGKETNLTIAFFTREMRPMSLDGISLTWFDVDQEPCWRWAGWRWVHFPSCPSQSVESITPKGSYSAYVSNNSQMDYVLNRDGATFTALQDGDGSDNPVSSRLMTQAQMDKAVTLVYSHVHMMNFTLGVSQGQSSTLPRIFFFDFVPTLLCAQTLPELPAWMKVEQGHGDETARPTTTTSTTTSVTSTTATTTDHVAKCESGAFECEPIDYSGSYWDLRYVTAKVKCGLLQARCWVIWTSLEALGWLSRQCLVFSRALATLFGGTGEPAGEEQLQIAEGLDEEHSASAPSQ